MKFFTTIFFLSFMLVGFGHIAKAAEENPSGNRDGLGNVVGKFLAKKRMKKDLEKYNALVEMDTETVRQMGAEEVVKIVNGIRKYFVGESDMESNMILTENIVALANRVRGEVGIALLKELSKDPRARWIVAEYAGVIGGSAGIDLLWGFVEDKNPHMRRRVAKSAKKIGAFLLLEKLVDDKNVDVRAGVARSAGEIGGHVGIALLKMLAEDKDAYVRMMAARSAGEIGGEAVIVLLEKLAEDDDLPVRIEVARSAGEIGGEAVIVLLEKLAENDDIHVKIEAARSAGKIGGKVRTALLRKFIRGERRTAGENPSNDISKEIGMTWLKRFAESEHVELRMLAVGMAALIGGEGEIALLQELAKDKDFQVKIEVATSAKRIEEKNRAGTTASCRNLLRS